jgi:hypothetical protein
MNKSWTEWTDDELASEAQAGLRGQGAVVETSRRLIIAIRKLDDSATRLSRWLVALTVVLVILTAVLVVLTILTSLD